MRRQKKKKLNFKKVLLILILAILIFNLYNKYNNKINVFLQNILTSSDYKIIKQDTNPNYLGIGQEKISNKDGYFTTFTTNTNKTYIEYKQNGTSSWSRNSYWGGTMEENGCGITSLSIILSGYNKKYTPEDLRKKYYPKLNYENLSKELKSFGIENSDFYYDSINCSEKSIKTHLETDRPIIICVWTENGKNRWTTKSHYMVLLATDGDNMVYISNPNGLKNESKSSGWYELDEVVPYIAKILYIESD